MTRARVPAKLKPERRAPRVRRILGDSVADAMDDFDVPDELVGSAQPEGKT